MRNLGRESVKRWALIATYAAILLMVLALGAVVAANVGFDFRYPSFWRLRH